MNKNSFWTRGDKMAKNAFMVAQLAVCGAVIGLYCAKAFGFVGFAITPSMETAGVATGAILLGALSLYKAIHSAD